MTEVQQINQSNSLPEQQDMEDNAYLMTLGMMGDSDGHLLPSTMMTFTNLFGEEEEQGGDLNAEELNDIACLLAPQVSDDDASSSSSSSKGDSYQYPHLHAEIPILPKSTGSGSGDNESFATTATKVMAAGSQKRTFASTADTEVDKAATEVKAEPASKKTKTEAKKAAGKGPASVPMVPKETPNPLSLHTAASLAHQQARKKALAPLAPKSPANTKKAPTSATSSNATDIAKNAVEASIKANANAAAAVKIEQESGSNTTATSTSTSKEPLTEAERAKACRDRNRQHARNTRLRKKAYVEEMKKSLRDMVEQRDAALAREQQLKSIEKQQREVRYQVMQDFLQLRANNEQNAQRWSAILVPGTAPEEEFTLTMPKTYFQAMVHNDEDNNSAGEQVLKGVNDVMADAQYFASFVQSLGCADNSVSFAYHCDRSNFLMDGCNGMLTWAAKTNGMGDKKEIALTGSMRARFCPQTNRLKMVKIHFDTGVIAGQVARHQQQHS